MQQKYYNKNKNGQKYALNFYEKEVEMWGSPNPPLIQGVDNENVVSIEIDVVRFTRRASIAPGAFSNCKYLEEVSMPEEMLKYYPAFYGSPAYEDLQSRYHEYILDREHLEENELPPFGPIGSAFWYLPKLKELTVPKGLYSFYPGSLDSAFIGCESLERVVLEEGVENLACAFTGCKSLKFISIPASVKKLGGALGLCDSLEELVMWGDYDDGGLFQGITNDSVKRVICFSETPTIVGSTPNATWYVPENAIDAYTKVIDAFPLQMRQECISVDLVAPLAYGKTVDEKAQEKIDELFAEAQKTLSHQLIGLKSLQLESIKTREALRLQHKLDIDENGTLLAAPENLCYLSVPENVVAVGSGKSFCFPDTLEYVDMPESVEDIRDGAFSGCVNLKRASMESVNTIGNHAFQYCNDLASITFPRPLVSIGDEAFLQCSRLSSIHLPKFLKHIGDRAFAKCINLKQVCIPQSVVEIGMSAFAHIPALESFTVDADNPAFCVLDGALLTKDGKRMCACALAGAKVIRIPDGVETIDDEIFQYCSSVETVALPASLRIIGSGFFKTASQLKEVLIPKGTSQYFQELLPENLSGRPVSELLKEV